MQAGNPSPGSSVNHMVGGAQSPDPTTLAFLQCFLLGDTKADEGDSFSSSLYGIPSPGSVESQNMHNAFQNMHNNSSGAVQGVSSSSSSDSATLDFLQRFLLEDDVEVTTSTSGMDSVQVAGHSFGYGGSGSSSDSATLDFLQRFLLDDDDDEVITSTSGMDSVEVAGRNAFQNMHNNLSGTVQGAGSGSSSDSATLDFLQRFLLDDDDDDKVATSTSGMDSVEVAGHNAFQNMHNNLSGTVQGASSGSSSDSATLDFLQRFLLDNDDEVTTSTSGMNSVEVAGHSFGYGGKSAQATSPVGHSEPLSEQLFLFRPPTDGMQEEQLVTISHALSICRPLKPACMHCGSADTHFRYLNNAGKATSIQPRYQCNACKKLFTSNGKLRHSYKTSSTSTRRSTTSARPAPTISGKIAKKRQSLARRQQHQHIQLLGEHFPQFQDLNIMDSHSYPEYDVPGNMVDAVSFHTATTCADV